MAKCIYIGDAASRKVKNLYIGINNESRKIKTAYVGVNNSSRIFYNFGYVWKKYKTVYTDEVITRGENASSREYFITSVDTNKYKTLTAVNSEKLYFDEASGKFVPTGIIYFRKTIYYDNISANAVNYNDYTTIEEVPSFAIYCSDSIIVTYQKSGIYAEPWSWTAFNTHSVGTAKGSYIEDVISDNPNAYPINGRHTDGYWYVRQ